MTPDTDNVYLWLLGWEGGNSRLRWRCGLLEGLQVSKRTFEVKPSDGCARAGSSPRRAHAAIGPGQRSHYRRYLQPCS